MILATVNLDWLIDIHQALSSCAENVNILTWWRSSAGHKWIPNVSLIAHTNRHMVGHLAVCITSTQTRTRVNTLQVPTLFGCWTISVDNTFRTTGHIWITKVFWDTLTGGCTVAFTANCIGSTRCWVAWINNFSRRRWGWSLVACGERIANVAGITCALRQMIADRALRVCAAHSGTRILALLLDTRQGRGTLGVDGALGFAFDVRVAEQAGQAGTAGSSRALPTFGVDTAGRWPARINDFWSWGSC